MERLSKARQQRSGRGRALSGPVLRVGFVALNDCAPLVVAQELGLFERHGLRVRLSRELGWASVRDKLAYGELEAAHAPCGLPFALALGLDGIREACCTGLVLNLHGNAITLSMRLWEAGVRDAAGFGEWVRGERGRVPTLGAVSRHSTHGYLLRRWLATAGLVADRDVRIVIVPPSQMWANLRAGHLDGYCVGEPWNSSAILAGDGWCAATSCTLAPRHPEKVLAVRGAWAAADAEAHVALVAAVLEACRLCDDPARREEVVRILARPEYLNLPVHLVRPAWGGEFPVARGETRSLPEFTCFHRFDANEPTLEKASWVVREVLGLPAGPGTAPSVLSAVHRLDVYEAARRRLSRSFQSLNTTETDNEPHLLQA